MCPVGTYNGQVSQLKCAVCPVGTFNPAVGQTACQACPAGTTTNSPGSALPSACVASLCLSSSSLVMSASTACVLPSSSLVNGVSLPSTCSTVCSLPFLAYFSQCWPSTAQPPFALTQFAAACSSNQPPMAPSPVVGVTVQAIADATMSLSWPIPNANRAPITSYNVSYTVAGSTNSNTKTGTPRLSLHSAKLLCLCVFLFDSNVIPDALAVLICF